MIKKLDLSDWEMVSWRHFTCWASGSNAGVGGNPVINSQWESFQLQYRPMRILSVTTLANMNHFRTVLANENPFSYNTSQWESFQLPHGPMGILSVKTLANKKPFSYNTNQLESFQLQHGPMKSFQLQHWPMRINPQEMT